MILLLWRPLGRLIAPGPDILGLITRRRLSGQFSIVFSCLLPWKACSRMCLYWLCPMSALTRPPSSSILVALVLSLGLIFDSIPPGCWFQGLGLFQNPCPIPL